MDSRVNRYQRKKIERKIERKIGRRRKVLILVLMFILFGGLAVVDKSSRELMCIDDRRLFDYERSDISYNFQLLGKDYFIDDKKIDNILDSAEDSVVKISSTIGKYTSRAKRIVLNLINKNDPG